MRRNWLLPLGLTTALGALALPALAHDFERGEGRGQGYGRAVAEHGDQGRGADGHRGMFEMMRQMHGATGPGMMDGPGAMGRDFGPGRSGRFGQGAGFGPLGGPGGMGGMMQTLDADGDGTVTPDELRSELQDRLTEFDADESGTLSIDEFEALHSAMIREAMVDRFQALDNDGDGEVTAEEMTAPADRMQRMQDLRGRMQQQMPDRYRDAGPRSTMPMQGVGPEGGAMREGGMINGNRMPQGNTAEPSGN